jgi:hypothetical protein
MYIRKTPILWLLVLVLLIVVPTSVQAEPPPLPSSFYGTVKVDGKDAPSGTSITAWIKGVNYGDPATVAIYNGNTVFSISVPGDELSTPQIEGGVRGDVVQFRIDNQTTDQQGVWKSGTNVQLDLSSGTGMDRAHVYLPLMMR